MTKIALTIAGSDSSAGAGIQADLKTFSALKVYGTTVVTVLTAQNTQGIRSIAPVEPKFVRDQIDCLFGDMDIEAVKIGMLGTVEIIDAVAEGLEAHKPAHVVVDPVMVSSSGHRVLSREATDQMIARIFPLTTLLTPNLDEAAVLLNEPVIGKASEMEGWAKKIAQLGVSAVLLKGGHLKSTHAPDVLYYQGQCKGFNTGRINTKNTHGTGCTLSAAITAFLATGLNLPQAVKQAKAYITGAIKAADELDIGKGAGPLNHFWQQKKG
jgi:hydroxymethylpyrimidine/phosphomethylpyrimidine kinase